MRFAQQLATGNYYFTVMDLVANKIFDFSSNTWVNLGSGTTPYVVAAGVSIGTKSIYSADINLALLFQTGTTVHEIAVMMYQQSGGSPAPSTDTVQAQFWRMRLCCGHVVPDNAADCPFKVEVTADLTNTGGTSMHLTAELTLNGVTIPLNSLDTGATCSFAVTQDATTTGGARVSQFTIATGTVGAANSSSRFEAEYANPNLTANRGFTCVATITTGGVVYAGECKFMTF